MRMSEAPTVPSLAAVRLPRPPLPARSPHLGAHTTLIATAALICTLILTNLVPASGTSITEQSATSLTSVATPAYLSATPLADRYPLTLPHASAASALATTLWLTYSASHPSRHFMLPGEKPHTHIFSRLR